MTNENGTRSAEMIEEVADKNYYDRKMPCRRTGMDASTMIHEAMREPSKH